MNDILSTGIVTFLFTDIEGSTRLWEQHPEAMQRALARHDAILRQAISDCHGTIIKNTGDGCYATFASAADSLSAALIAQQTLQADGWQALQPHSLRVRIGIHSGEAEHRAGDYFGPALNRAARLMSVGYGGQILVSQATAELARDRLPVDAALMDLGEHRLKDLTRPEHVFQLAHPALQANFPALKSLDTFPNNLPVQLTTFVGREREISEIEGLLNSTRLVTLTGSGGTGKTRLTQEVSVQSLAHFPHGVWLVELAPLSDPAQIVPTLAQVFGLQEQPSNPLLNIVQEYLREKKLLLILDNCEHLIATCANLADVLLRHCPRLKILASSREALGIAGEATYHTPSLAESESIQLFVERARLVNSSFQRTEANAAAIAQICHRLDGIPLALELAAARVKLLTPEQIAARLDDRFSLLVGGSRTALPRQQTLRALVDWSYNLLADEEKRLLQAASVFVGGWTLEGLEAVAQDPGALELLEQLVNKSLVVTEACGVAMRFSMLETIRQYAREKLLDASDAAVRQARDRHLAFIVKLTEAANPRLLGPDMIACLDELEQEQDNLRAALEWALENDPLSALRISVILHTFWARRLPATEGLAWVTKALARAGQKIHLEGADARPYLQARAQAQLGQAALIFQLGDNHTARTTVEACIADARQANATDVLALGLALGATICGFVGDATTMHAWTQEAIALSRQYGYAYTLANAIGLDLFLAVIMDQPTPSGLVEETLQAAHLSGNPWVLGLTYNNLGRLEVRDGHLSKAYQYLKEAVVLFGQIRDRAMYHTSQSEIGHLLRKQGRLADAAAVYRETIQTYREHDQQAAVAHQLECFAFLAVAQDQDERAAQLFGAAQALRARLSSDMTPYEHREYGQIVARLQSQMQPDALKKAWETGRTWTLEQAIQFAVA